MVRGAAVSDEVGTALADGQPVVALESTLLVHGLPRPDNERIAHELADEVRAGGAVPATIAVLGGTLRVGLTDSELAHLARSEAVKASVRELPLAVAGGMDAATTVGSTAHVAARAGIDAFATGGLGGVHREARDTWDESGDLVALSRAGTVVVCAGVKSILDVGATLERLETFGVPVVGYRTHSFPGFYLTDSGHELDWRLDTPDAIARARQTQALLDLGSRALVVAQPLPQDEQVDPVLHDQVLADALAELRDRGVHGKDVTPFLLERFHEATGGESLRANVAIVRRNARLAGEIAAAASALARG
ncbi:pseudouridine-5'-phosphate glycosidase [Egibacter rhizosphaerae]|uniref:Pseudouridine-5'-phosphate glycosidase n=1 Tax=Egibacter rhizosphaerae TaxID=1670831 RepID=A0A411YL75_9ACTN|nr:pseudouridine-5'-phosphate glycosidase [Egibacter rhizosphaerae]